MGNKPITTLHIIDAVTSKVTYIRVCRAFRYVELLIVGAMSLVIPTMFDVWSCLI